MVRQSRVIRHTLYFQETLNTTDTERITEQQGRVTVPVLTVISPSGPVSASLIKASDWSMVQMKASDWLLT